ncbi:MAG: hypothetical protein NVS1B13_01040 [Flavisolibacter sp.]
MKPKVILLNGGPRNGEIAYVYKNVKEYNVSATKKGIKHIYREDEKLAGYFIYTGYISQ